MTKYYKCNIFGLVVSSEVPLGMIGKRVYKSHKKGDVHILKGEVPYLTKNGTISGSGHYVENDSTYYSVPEVGRFEIKGGEKIIVDKEKEVEKNIISLYLLGICIANILRQRKHIVIHGSCIHINGKTILFAGTQGSGKSTLAAASTECGAELVSDDISPIKVSSSGKAEVSPGHPQVKLWPKSIDMLGYGCEKSYRLHSDVDKRYIIVEEDMAKESQVIDYFCEISEGKRLSAKEVKGRRAFELIYRNLFLKNISQPSHEKARQLHDICKIAKKVKVCKLNRKYSNDPTKVFKNIVDKLDQ